MPFKARILFLGNIKLSLEETFHTIIIHQVFKCIRQEIESDLFLIGKVVSSVLGSYHNLQRLRVVNDFFKEEWSH